MKKTENKTNAQNAQKTQSAKNKSTSSKTCGKTTNKGAKDCS